MAHRVRDGDTDKEEYFRFFDEAYMIFNANSSDSEMILICLRRNGAEPQQSVRVAKA